MRIESKLPSRCADSSVSTQTRARQAHWASPARLFWQPTWLMTALWLMVLAIPALRAQDPEPDEPHIRVDVNLVTLRFSVRDSGGFLVNNLAQDSFRVLQNGIPQDIVFFEPPRHRSARQNRFWLAFLLDVSGSTSATRAEEIVAAQTFLENLTDVTQVGIFGFTDKLLPFQPFTSNRDLVLKAFREARRHLGRTAIYDSLNSLITTINTQAPSGDEKAIIVISDGLDDVYLKSASSIALARQAGISLYTILVPSAAQIYIGPSAQGNGPGSSPVNRLDPEREAKEAAFSRLSTATGGKHFSGFETILQFDDTLAQITEDLFGNLYSIGFYSDQSDGPARRRNIDIQTKEAYLKVSAPFTRFPEEDNSKRDVIAALFDNRRFSQISGEPPYNFHEIGAQLDVLPSHREGGSVGLPFRLKINPLSFPGADRKGITTQFGVLGMLLDRDGNETVRLREIFRVNLGAKEIREGQGIIYSNKLLAPPGEYQLKVALLELSSWRLTSFDRVVRVSEP